MNNPLHYITIHEAISLLSQRKISSLELTNAIFDRIDKTEEKVGSYITTNRDEAIDQAKKADQNLSNNTANLLTGIPIAIKDVICTKGITTTCGSHMLENFHPPYDASVITKLYESGAIIIGKSNMDEFAMGSSTENSSFHPTHNPWDLSRVPGGSSGGSAAAVAAGQALASLGSDTGGSIRQPASFCGTVGLKPTYGRVSRFGLIAFASSLDQIGPLSRNVHDSAIMLNAISGHDPKDSTSIEIDTPDFTSNLSDGIAGMNIGVPREYFVEGIDVNVTKSVETAIDHLENLGAKIDRSLSLPSTKYAVAAYYIIAPSEASANLARYDGVKYGYSHQDGKSMWEDLEETRGLGFGKEVKRRIMLGTYALSAGYYDAYYLKAQKIRTIIRHEFDEAFKKYDAIVAPVSPTTAFKLGERADDPLAMYMSDVCTIPANIAGLPAISVPCGFVNKLPVGLQIIGRAFSEDTILKIAHTYEQGNEWHKQNPDL